MVDMTPIRPTLAEVPAYMNALKKGWSPDNVRGAEVASEQFQALGD